MTTPGDVVLHRIEALPGDGRYAVTFRRADGSEQTAVAQVRGDDIGVAEASLPVGWTRAGEQFARTAAAIHAVEAARRASPGVVTLRDVDGGWDVSMGNVVLGADGAPSCTAHGTMTETGGIWVCAECEARAAYS